MKQLTQTNLTINERERDLLKKIAKIRSISMSGTVRQLIIEEAKRVIE